MTAAVAFTPFPSYIIGLVFLYVIITMAVVFLYVLPRCKEDYDVKE